MTCNLCKAEPCEPWCKYEYPIHQIPPVKTEDPDSVHHEAIHRVLVMLRENNDHYGASLIIDNAHKLFRVAR